MPRDAISAVRPAIGRIICRDINSTGTAFVVNESGYLVSANHVVSKMAFSNGSLVSNYSKDIQIEICGKAYDAAIVNDLSEPAPLVYDYVILKIEPDDDLSAIKIEPLSNISQGDDVICAGFPLDFDEMIVSKGIVSALVRHPSSSNSLQIVNSIVTDADMQFGTSGGPLLYADTGNVAGINTRKHNHMDDLQSLYFEAKQSLSETDYVRRLIESTLKFRHLGFHHANAIQYVTMDPAYPKKGD